MPRAASIPAPVEALFYLGLIRHGQKAAAGLPDIVANYLLVMHDVRPAFLVQPTDYPSPRVPEAIHKGLIQGGLVSIPSYQGTFYTKPERKRLTERRVEEGRDDSDATAVALGYPVRGGLPHPLLPHRWGMSWLAYHRTTDQTGQIAGCVTTEPGRFAKPAKAWTKAMRHALAPYNFQVVYEGEPMPPLSDDEYDYLLERFGPPPRQ